MPMYIASILVYINSIYYIWCISYYVYVQYTCVSLHWCFIPCACNYISCTHHIKQRIWGAPWPSAEATMFQVDQGTNDRRNEPRPRLCQPNLLEDNRAPWPGHRCQLSLKVCAFIDSKWWTLPGFSMVFPPKINHFLDLGGKTLILKRVSIKDHKITAKMQIDSRLLPFEPLCAHY